MLNILLYISNILIIFTYILYLMMILLNQKKSVSRNTGFDVAKDIIEEYNSINIIENSGYFTTYNIKRRVIKLSKKCYYGKSLSMISLALIEAGISAIDNNNNKYINLIKHTFSNIKILYIFPIIAIIISNSTYNIYDAKINLILLVVLSFISYITINIKNESISWIKNNIYKIKEIKKNNQEKIIKFIKALLELDKIIIYSEIIMIIRIFFIILQ